MEEKLKQYLGSIGVAVKKIAEIEVSGINTEEQLKAKVNECPNFNTLAKELKIGLGAAKALFEKLHVTPVVIGTSLFCQVMGLFAATVELELSVVASALEEDLGAASDDFVSMILDPDITDVDSIVDALTPVGAKAAKVRLGMLKIREQFGAKAAPAASNGRGNPALEFVDPNKELADGEEPSKAQISSFASNIGMDPITMMMFMQGSGGDMDLSSMVPIATLVAGYNPKRRDMFLMMMGHVERRLGVPVVVINEDGSINRLLTTEYIEGLEEGRDSAQDNIYFDVNGTPYEVIKAGVDAQSVYSADPLDSTKALQKSGMGIGRVNWAKVSIEVKQVVYFAVTRTHEINPQNEAHLSWLRDNVKPGKSRLTFHGQAPRAIKEYNEAARTGSLPTLLVMLTRSPRRPEVMPRRTRTSPQDLSGIGGDPSGFNKVTRRDFDNG